MTLGHQGVGRYRRENLNLSRCLPPMSNLHTYGTSHRTITPQPTPFSTPCQNFFTALVPTIGTPSRVTITANPDV